MTPERCKEIEALLDPSRYESGREGAIWAIVAELLAEVERLSAIEAALQTYVLNSVEFWDVIQRVGYVEPASRSVGKRIDE